MLALLLLHFTETESAACLFIFHSTKWRIVLIYYTVFFFSFSVLAAQYNLLTSEDIAFFYIEVTLKLCLFLLLLPVTFLTREAPV